MGGGGEAQASSSMWRDRYKGRQGGRWLNTPLVWLFVSLDWKLGWGWGAGVTHYKGVPKLKLRLFSFIYLFIFCQKLHRAAGDQSELASICHDEGPGTPCLALPAPNTHTPRPPLSAPIQPHYTETFHFALPNCRSPLVWLQRTLIFILGRAVALVLAGVRPLLPLLLCHITRTGWKVNEAVVSLLSNFLQSSFKCCFLSAVLTLFVCLNLTLWTFPPCNSVHYIDGEKMLGWGGL